MSKDVEIVLQPTTTAVTSGDEQPYVKIFCADHKVAVALLRDLIMFAGAHNDVVNGKTTEDMTKKLAKNTHVFLVDIGDRLMIDCGLDEKDIESIVKEISENFKLMSDAQQSN